MAKKIDKKYFGEQIDAIWVDESVEVVTFYNNVTGNYETRINGVEMGQEQKKKQGDDAQPFGGLSYEVPETKGIMQALDEAFKEEIKDEHKLLMEEEEKQDQGKGAKKKKRVGGGQICICMSPGCYIGPMQNKGKKEIEE